MTTRTISKAADQRTAAPNHTPTARHYPLRYRVRDYTFPTSDAIAAVHFDDRYLHIELADERVLSIPLSWLPPLRDASPSGREKYHISEAGDALIWDPDEGEVNEILRLADYLSARRPKA